MFPLSSTGFYACSYAEVLCPYCYFTHSHLVIFVFRFLCLQRMISFEFYLSRLLMLLLNDVTQIEQKHLVFPKAIALDLKLLIVSPILVALYNLIYSIAPLLLLLYCHQFYTVGYKPGFYLLKMLLKSTPICLFIHLAIEESTTSIQFSINYARRSCMLGLLLHGD